MKKTTKAAAILCIMNCALTMPSCTNDESVGNDGRTELRLSSGLTVQDVSRASNDLQSTTFDKGNNIDVFIYEDATTATTTYGTDGKLTYTADGSNGLTTYNADNTENKQYWPASGNGVNIYAFYPSDLVSDAKSSEDVTFTVKEDQSSDDNYKASDLMYGVPSTANPVARTSKEVNVQFNHLLSKVTIVLKSGDGEPDLDGAKVELLNVKPIVSFTPSTGKIGDASGDASTITVFTASSSSLKGSCIVPPQELGTEFVKVTLKDGGELYGSLASGKPNLKSGYAYTYTITVNLTGLDITPSISKWGEGASGDISASMVNTINLSKVTADQLTDDYIASLITDGKLTIVGEYDQAKLAKISAYVREGNRKSPAVTTLDISGVTGNLTEFSYSGDNQTDFEGSNSLTTAILPTSVTNI